MKLIFKKNDLLESLSSVTKAVPSNAAMPILKCLLIDATGDDIHLFSSDTELSIDTVTQGRKNGSGRLAIDARLFTEIIRKLPDTEADVIIDTEDLINIKISCQKAVFFIQGMDAEEYPVISSTDRSDYIATTQFKLKELIRQTSFSLSSNDTNTVMTGELFEIKGDRLMGVTLDGHRVSLRHIDLNDTYENRKIIVPGKTLNEIMKIIPGDAQKEVAIYFDKNYISFEFDKTVATSRLIEGEFFPIESIIKPDFKTMVRVNQKEFIENIERSMILIRESDNTPLVMDISESSISMSVNASMGVMDSSLESVTEGDNIKIAVNPRYLLDAAKAADDEELCMYLNTQRSPIYIRDEEENYVYMILPVNFL